MDARSLECFLEILAAGSFRGAAARLGLSQPALSARIQRLEDQLGFPLFDRSSPKIEATPRALAFRPYAQDSVDALKRAQAAAQPIRDGAVGRLRLGYTPIAALSVAPALVRAFRARFPRVVLELSELTSDPIERAVADGALDVGLLHPPTQTAGVALQTLPSARFVAALPTGDPLARDGPASLGDLADRTFVMVSRAIGAHAFDGLIAECRRAGFQPKIVQEVETSISVLGMVAAGIGVGLVIEPLGRFSHDEIKFFPLPDLLMTLPFALAFRESDHPSLVDNFLSLSKSLVSD